MSIFIFTKVNKIMKFQTKLREYIKEEKLRARHFAALIGVSPAMVHKYLYCGAMPSFKTAKKIHITTSGFIGMEDMGYEYVT
jgi:predicted transcriptional regulator